MECALYLHSLLNLLAMGKIALRSHKDDNKGSRHSILIIREENTGFVDPYLSTPSGGCSVWEGMLIINSLFIASE